MVNIEYIAAFVINYKNHLKSRTHTNNIRKREQLNKSFQVLSQYQIFPFINVYNKYY